MTFNYKHTPCVAGSRSCPAEFANPAWNLVRADAYYPSPEGIYNLLGNAAEMTAEPGKAMGGSFRQYAWECQADQSQHYSQPEDWLGFRYVVTQ